MKKALAFTVTVLINLSGGEESKKIPHRCFMNVICDKKCTKVLFLAKAFF